LAPFLLTVQPDRNKFAPRLGLAWHPMKQTVVRLGYGLITISRQYGTVIQNFAFQPPFATTQTIRSGTLQPVTDTRHGFPGTASGAVTNNFAIDPNYRLGYVQIWNLDLQKTLPPVFS